MSTGAKCWACTFYDRERKICTRDGSGWSGKHREPMDAACKGFRSTSLARQESRTAALDPQTADALTANVQLMGKYIMQMGQLLGSMQKRLDDLEAKQAAVTIGHRDVLQLMARIRWKAGTVCMKYSLDDASVKIIRAAIKKDVLKRYQLKDLHDLPAAMLPAAEKQIDSWTDIRLVMERRGTT